MSNGFSYDAKYFDNLRARINYEMQALNRVRKYDHTIRVLGPNSTLSMLVCNKNGDIDPGRGLNSSLAIADHMGAYAAMDVLDAFRPLVFSAAFKILDMIFEWIAQANGTKAWTFREKVLDLENRSAAGNLKLPSYFAAERVVYDSLFLLYKNLTGFRNKIQHAGGHTVQSEGFQLEKNGAITLKSRDGTTDQLTNAEQGAFVTVALLVIGQLLESNVDSASYNRFILEHLHQLSRFSGTALLANKKVRLEAVQVRIPDDMALNHIPYHAQVNMEHVWEHACRSYPAGDGELMLVMEVVGERPGLTLLSRHYKSHQLPKTGILDIT